jgi:glycosyltransferase involved in cell wall biosynthesis
LKLVSILIPAYKPHFFRECLTSALAQTWRAKEIIVSDDSRTEEIQEISAEYGRHVSYLRNPSPGVLGHNNIRHLCRIAQGAYLKFLFDDDLLHPFCVQYLVEALEREAPRGATLAFSPRIKIDRDNRPIERIDAFAGRIDRLLDGREVIRQMASTMLNPIGEFTTVLFRRNDIFDRNGDLQIMSVEGVHWRGLSDVALFIHLCEKGAAVMVEDVLSYFRVHTHSNSDPAANPEWFYAVADWKLVLDYALERRLLSRNEIVAGYRNLIQLLSDQQVVVPALRDEFAKVLNRIRCDIDAAGLERKSRQALLAMLPA